MVDIARSKQGLFSLVIIVLQHCPVLPLLPLLLHHHRQRWLHPALSVEPA